MKRQSGKLGLSRETIRRLDTGDLAWARGADEISIQSGETHCWCTDSCDETTAGIGQIRFRRIA